MSQRELAERAPVGLKIRNGTKVYPGTVALDAVDFDLRMGAVNVLVGENGAGKSTMMKVIAGVERLTSGEILMKDEPVDFHSTDDATKRGIGIVHQELNLFPDLSVSDNIFMGRECRRFGIDIDRAEQREQTRVLMQRLEHDIDPDTMVSELRVGQQQIVEIAKSLAQDARILILDEPTSALSAAEVEILFRVIDELRRDGVGIVYISHRLEELIRIGDYITVLRDGKITGAQSMQGVDVSWIVRNMIGDASKSYAKAEPHALGSPVLHLEDVVLLRAGGGFAVDNVSLTVRAGEILGIYGLMGAGRSELLECIIGRHSHARGRIEIDGNRIDGPSISARIRRGIALIPEDRKTDGLIQIASIRENMTLSSLRDFTRGFHMDLKAERGRVADFVRRMTIKIASPENPVASLSGGNQQKVVIAKALMTEPKVLLMDEPSRGIDIGAKAEVFRVMRELAKEGLAIVFVTSDLEEVLSLSDRILVMADGRVTGEFDRADANETAVIRASAPASAERHLTHSEEKTA